MPSLNFSNLLAFLRHAPAQQKLVLGLCACLLLAGVIYLAVMYNQDEYQLLFAQLEAQDASGILDWLKQQHIPYRLGEGGGAIWLPVGKVAEVRLQLAGRGLPQSKAIGFEIFDKSNWGTTEFVQQVNYTRALQGELARTITHLDSVAQAVVHIVRPKPSVFQQSKGEVSASVFLQLKAGHQLTAQQVFGIGHLVSSAVEGLTPQRVTILDNRGQLLSNRPKENADLALSEQIERQKEIEEYLTHKAQSLLDQVLGSQRAVVRVNAELDWVYTQETSEHYDPEGQVLQQETVRSRKSRREPPAGATGSRAKLNAAVESRFTQEDEEDVTAVYANDKKVQRVEKRPGKLLRLSIGLVVQTSLAGEMEKLGKLIKETLGYNASRGDTFDLAAVAFQNPEEMAFPAPSAISTQEFVLTLFKHGALPFALVILAWVMVSIVKRERTRENLLSAVGKESPALAAASKSPSVVQEVQKMARENPETTQAILKKWFREA